MSTDRYVQNVPGCVQGVHTFPTCVWAEPTCVAEVDIAWARAAASPHREHVQDITLLDPQGLQCAVIRCPSALNKDDIALGAEGHHAQEQILMCCRVVLAASFIWKVLPGAYGSSVIRVYESIWLWPGSAYAPVITTTHVLWLYSLLPAACEICLLRPY